MNALKKVIWRVFLVLKAQIMKSAAILARIILKLQWLFLIKNVLNTL